MESRTVRFQLWLQTPTMASPAVAADHLIDWLEGLTTPTDEALSLVLASRKARTDKAADVATRALRLVDAIHMVEG